MTTKELLAAIADANDAGTPKIAIYMPSITHASQKNGLTTITLKVRVEDFTPSDVLEGIGSYLCIGTIEALKKLEGASTVSVPPRPPR